MKNHKSRIESRKRQRPGRSNSKSTSFTMSSSTTRKQMKQTQKVSLGLLLTFSLSINLAPSSVILAAGSEIDLSTKIHPSNSIDLSAAEIWQTIDDEGLSSLRSSPPSLLHLESEKQAPAMLPEPIHRSLRTKDRTRERFRKDHTFADFHYPATIEERHRLLIFCDENNSQDECLSELLKRYDEPDGEVNTIKNQRRRPIEIVHNLESINVLSVDVNTETLQSIVIDKAFVFEKDFIRGPLVFEGPKVYHQPSAGDGNRKLRHGQQIPWGLDAIRALDVWDTYGTKGEGVKICVLDSGVQASHEDFRQSNFDGYYGNEFISPFWYEDDKGHGTHIAGTIAASDNTIGIVGIAPEAETYIVRVFDDERKFYGFADGTAYSTDLIAAATICKEWGADIINASLGGNNYNRIEEEFFRNLFYKDGILTVAASGNGGNDVQVYPAAYDGVLSVGAVDESLQTAPFTTISRSTDVLAPGVNILSTFKKNVYATFSGTSMAAPHATGAFALMLSYIKSHQIDISSQDIFHVLKNNIAEGSNDETDNTPKVGMIDIYASINHLEKYYKQNAGRAPIISPKPKCDNEVQFDIITDSKGGELYYRLMRTSDREVLWMTGPNTLKNNSKYSEKSCLKGPEGCYQFDIRDKGGDGIANGGGIKINYNGHKLYEGGNFGRGGMLKFGDCHRL